MKDEKLKPIEELLQGTDFEDKYEPMVKMANQQVWLIDDLAGGIQEKLASQLRLMSFTILKSEKYPFYMMFLIKPKMKHYLRPYFSLSVPILR